MEKLPQEENARVVWTASLNEIFSSASDLLLGRDVGDTVTWCDVVWCHMFIPKHSFVVWRAMLQRLPTQSRLCKLKIINTSQCCFCCNNMEDFNHLYFECAFSRIVWNSILRNIYPRYRRPRPLAIECAWFKNTYKGKSTMAIIGKLSFNACICSIWKKRNQRRFAGRNLRMDMIVENIIFNVQTWIQGFRVD